MNIGIYALAIGLGLTALPLQAERLNDFDLRNLTVDRHLVMQGGPPRDGIPSLTNPKFVTAGDAKLRSGDRVIGVAHNGVAKAYPLLIMNWHEVVNDLFGEVPVAVTYCPLCYTGMAFLARHEGERMFFGVSGLLYNSDVLLYDWDSESLWSQIGQHAVSGPRVDTPLKLLPSLNTTWGDWVARYPETLVLSSDTGHRRDYRRDPYQGYGDSQDILFPIAFRAEGYHPKEKVIGITLGEVHRAYPMSELARAASPLTDRVGDQNLTIEFDARLQTGRILNAKGQELPSVLAYWFAWHAFHPETELFKGPR